MSDPLDAVALISWLFIEKKCDSRFSVAGRLRFVISNPRLDHAVSVLSREEEQGRFQSEVIEKIGRK